MRHAVAGVAWVALLFVPGLAVARLTARSRGWWWAFGVAPPVSLGLLYLVAQAASRLGLDPAGAGAAGLALAGVVGVALAARAVRAARASRAMRTVPDARGSPATARDVSGAVILLGIAVAAGIVAWATFHAEMTVPPGWDAMHHGFFVRQILDRHTLDAATVLSSDAWGADAVGSSYPLAFDLAVASVQRITGLPVSSLMLASTAVAGAVVFPIGTFAFARHMGGPRSLVPGFAALACVLVVNLYGIEESGRLNVLVGLALVPGTALALLPGLWRPPWRALPIAVLAVVGVAAVHASEFPTVLVLVVATAVALAWQERAARGFGRWCAWATSAGVAAGTLLVAADPAVLGSAGERAGAIVAMTSGTWSGTHALVAALTIHRARDGLAAIDVVGVLVVLGCALTLRARWRRFLGPALACAAFVAAYLVLVTGHGALLGPIATPWYGESARLSWNLFALAPIPVGVAAAAVAGWVGDRISRVVDWHPHAVAGVACGIALVVVGQPPVPGLGALVTERAGPVGPDAQRAFAYLAVHESAGSRVFDDLRVDGAMWMYVDDGVPTLFGNAPYLGGAPESWKERLWLRDNLLLPQPDDCVPVLLAKYRVEHLYFGERGIADGPRHQSLETLRSDDSLTEVFTSGPAHVFRVDLPAGALSCPRDVAATVPWDRNGQ